MGRKKIFVVCYGGGHVNIIKNIYPELVKKFEVVILPLTTAKSFLKKNNIPYKDLKYYYDVLEETEDVLELGRSFISNFNIDFEKIGFEESQLYYGYNVRDYISFYNENSLKENYKKEGRLTFLPLITMEKILKFERPDAVLTTYSPRFERAALLASRKLAIPNFSIEGLHGLSRLINLNERKRGDIYYGDNIFVINDFAKNNISNSDVKFSNIYVTGSPAFDMEIYNLDDMSSITKENKFKVLYLTNDLPKKFEILDRLIEYLNEINKEYEIAVKIHPSEKITDYRKCLPDIKIEEDNLYRNILKADLVITNCSTASIEAAYLDKDVINITMDIPESFCSFFKNLNITYFADNYQELKQNLIEINSGNKKESTVEINRKNNYNLGSAKRIVKIINDTI